jgi:ribosomal protein L11 methyltransferase
MPFVCIRLQCNKPLAKNLSEILPELGALSVTIHDANAQSAKEKPIYNETWESEPPLWETCKLDILVHSETDVSDFMQNAKTCLDIKNLPEYQISPVPEQDWIKLGQEQLKPSQIRDKLWIVPSWHTPPDAQAMNIIIKPGQAFGTGHHASTILCLEWLEKYIKGGETVLDYGCGSGILGITTMKLGASRCTGVDIHDASLAESRENCKLNRVQMELLMPDRLPDTRFDIVISNILAGILKELASHLSSLVNKNGSIVLSGILNKQKDDLSGIYSKSFEMHGPLARQEWVCLHGTRR